MKRRDFIALAAAAAVAPRASAQQRMPKIGFLATAAVAQTYLPSLQSALREHGYIDGKTMRLDLRTPARADQLSQVAADLVKTKPDVIVTVFTQPTQAAKQATTTIPIVFLGVGDPAGTGLVASLNRPGGNLTGIGDSAAEANAKTLSILAEVLPRARRVAVLTDPSDPYAKTFLEHLRQAGKQHLIEIQAVPIQSHDMLEGAIAGLRPKPDAAIVQGSFPRRAVELLLKHGVPSGGTPESFIDAGSLVCYAIDTQDTCRKGVEYAHRILQGAKPADLPVQLPKRNLIINQRAARALGILVPEAVTLRADRVIE
jgi:putative ABC transport system substrate-binding protein